MAARKRNPALTLASTAALDALAGKLARRGHELLLDADVQLLARATANHRPPRAASTGGLGSSVNPSSSP